MSPEAVQAGRTAAEKLLDESGTLRVCFSVLVMSWRLYQIARQVLDRYIAEHAGEIENPELVKELLVQSASANALKPFDSAELSAALASQGIGFVDAFTKQHAGDVTAAERASHTEKVRAAEARKTAEIACRCPLKSRDEPVIARDKPTIVIGPDAARLRVFDFVFASVMSAGADDPEAPLWNVVRFSGTAEKRDGGPRCVWVPLPKWQRKLTNTGAINKLLDEAEESLEGQVDLLIIDDAIATQKGGMAHPAQKTATFQKLARRVMRERGFALLTGTIGDESFWNNQPATVATAVTELREHTYLRYVSGNDQQLSLQNGWWSLGNSSTDTEKSRLILP